MRHRTTAASVAAGLATFAVATASWCQAITDPTKPPPATPPTPATGVQPSQSSPSALTLTAAYTADLLNDVSGGAATGSGYVHLIKFSAAYDGSTAGHDGLTGLVSVAHLSGSNFTSKRVDGVQSISASETDFETLRLYEAWLQQEVLSGSGGVKLGLIDLNTTFDVQETAALFLNASHGIGPDLGDTGRNGPSDYPTPAAALTGFYRPAEGWTVQAGVFDGTAGDPAHRSSFFGVKFDGALLIGQIERRFGDAARVEVGGWAFTGRFPTLDKLGATGTPKTDDDDRGVYALVEGRLLPKPDQKDGGLNGWVRLGLANGDINQVSNYEGAGLVYTGPFEGREKDEVGVALARAGLGGGARFIGAQAGERIGRAETDVEATYRYAATDWLNVQPDIQYVMNPRGDRSRPNALVVGLRLAFTYTK